jgi:hypothetical protein
VGLKVKINTAGATSGEIVKARIGSSEVVLDSPSLATYADQ